MVIALGAVVLVARGAYAHFWDDFGRDLGIAFIVSGVIAMLIELRRSSMEEKEAGITLLNEVLGSAIGAEAWLEIQNLIAERHQIRRNAQITFEEWTYIDEARSLAKAKIRYRYDAYSTTGRSEDGKIRHELDYHLRTEGAPRWVSVSINGQPINVDPGDSVVDEHVSLSPSTPTTVETIRYELIYVPGAWNLYFTQWTQGLMITFSPTLEDLEIKPVIHPRDEIDKVDQQGSNLWVYKKLLLPGQGLEFKFTRLRK